MGAKRLDRLILTAIGFLSGFAYWLAFRFWPHEPTARAVATALIAFVTVVALVMQLSWTGRDRRRIVALATGVGALFAAVTLW
jgi:hypothetical protein